MSLLEDELNAYRARLHAEDSAQMQVMARRWSEVTARMQAEIDLLADKIAELKLAGHDISYSRLYQLDRYQQLLKRAQSEHERFAKWSAGQISEVQSRRVLDGLASAQSMIGASYTDVGAVIPSFKVLPVDAVNSMIGYAGDGTPLYNLLLDSYPDSVVSITRSLISGVGMGINPREVARQMILAGLEIPLKRALVVARTEQVRAYRDAGRQQMIESGVVKGWIRRAALQLRTCAACLAADGRFYPLESPMDDHPNGRCFQQPVVKGIEAPSSTSGFDWFQKQKPEDQAEILGDKGYEAWRDGKVQFSQFAKIHDDPVWGPTIYTPSVSSLLGG